MRDILKLGLLFLAIMAGVIVLGLIMSRCTNPDRSSETQEAEVVEEIAEETPTPTIEATNPQTVRGTATVDISAPSVTNGVFVANLYEAKSGQSVDEAVQVDSVTVEEINHRQGLPRQWDFRVTAPNASPDNTYFVLGTVYRSADKSEKALVGKCETGEVDELCSVKGSGNLMNFWMDLVALE